MKKNVKYTLPSTRINMGGIFVKQALPTQKIDQVDPFLLLHHGQFKFNDAAPAKQQGIGPHPHRGFSPVTFVIEGEVHHRDSRGHDQVAKAGEVQWMHAGAGIIHSERPTDSVTQKNSVQEVIQLWINSPAASKMDVPKYQYLSEAEMTIIEQGEGVKHKLIAGSYQDNAGSIDTESPLLILWSHLLEDGNARYSIPRGFNAMIYLVKGDVHIEGYGKLDAESLAIFEDEGDEISFTASEESQVLLLSGSPIEEKVVQHGPFVMNSETEILEAMRDYQMGKMGILIED